MITVTVVKQAQDSGKSVEIFKQAFENDEAFDLGEMVLTINKKTPASFLGAAQKDKK